MFRQTTSTLLMIRPAAFGYNTETAGDNAFQRCDGDLEAPAIQEHAQAEFDGFVALMKENDIEIVVVEDLPKPVTPDAIFPNNWLSLHQDGTVILYPMAASSRRKERRLDVIKHLENVEGFDIGMVVDLSANEIRSRYLEGTGSLVIDRAHKKAYACISQRTDLVLVESFCYRMGYEDVVFRAFDRSGNPVYHTNVVMGIGNKIALVCLDAIRDPQERTEVQAQLEKDGHEVIPISIDQMSRFAGNVLEVRARNGQPYMIMSRAAHEALNEEQIESIETHMPILSAPLEIIEKYGGGSARCMMCEVFLERV
jgi:hypothetical protein